MPSRNGVQRSTAGVIRYSMGKKIIIIFINLTGKNRGLSGLKNIWPVIMTGDLLSVILSLDVVGVVTLVDVVYELGLVCVVDEVCVVGVVSVVGVVCVFGVVM